MLDLVEIAWNAVLILTGFLPTYYYGRLQVRQAREDERRQAENRRRLSHIEEDVEVAVRDKLEPLQGALAKAVTFSVIATAASLGWKSTPDTILRSVEREDPQLMRAWKLLVPENDKREQLVKDLARVAERMESHKTLPGLHLSDDTTISFGRVHRVVNLPPFTRFAMFSQTAWWGRVMIVLIASVLVVVLSTSPALLYYPPLWVWPVWLVLGVISCGLFLLYVSKAEYREQCQNRHEYSVLFGPGQFKKSVATVMFGTFCPAMIGIPEDAEDVDA